MDSIVSNVLINVVSSIIYDIGRYAFGSLENDKTKFDSKAIEAYVGRELGSEYNSVYELTSLPEFLTSPLVKDTICNYVLYMVTGKLKKNPVRSLPKSIDEKSIIDYLVEQFIQTCRQQKTIVLPSDIDVYRFFKALFQLCSEYICDQMEKDDRMVVYFVNSRISFFGKNIVSRIDHLAKIIEKSLECKVVDPIEEYTEKKNQYIRMLKSKHKQAHIYLLDTFDIEKFYVPPVLGRKDIDGGILRYYWDNHYLRATTDKMPQSAGLSEDWRHIFEKENIVYIIGGAGYGKSLFLKKLINEYDKLNILDAKDYLVIYGDLKSFYINNSELPMPVLDFLKVSMEKETLLGDETISKSMIEYYLNNGRCIILLDALDEVSREKRTELHKSVINFFQNQNPNNKICITSRARGFVPDKNIEVFDIEPLNEIQIKTYVDNIIRLGKFKKADKESFLAQSMILVRKGFLNSFLVLSLLINIYKAERELPENKLELYQKCFDYIANKREKEKSQSKYDWKLISILMKDNTFAELANLCLPNNHEEHRERIKEVLIEKYKAKYVSENETELAIDQFLQFCSDRTELFVPAKGEDLFHFFHRSFFEYFYSRYIFTRTDSADSIYECWQSFDVDSEVFELTLAMYKQANEDRYQAIVEFLLDRITTNTIPDADRIRAINIFILCLQVIDDELYKKRFFDYIADNSAYIFSNTKKIHNQNILARIILERENDKKRISEKYESAALYMLIDSMYENYPNPERMIKDFMGKDGENWYIFGNIQFLNILSRAFYMNVFFDSHQPKEVFEGITIERFREICDQLEVPKKVKEKLIKRIRAFKKLSENDRMQLYEVMFRRDIIQTDNYFRIRINDTSDSE